MRKDSSIARSFLHSNRSTWSERFIPHLSLCLSRGVLFTKLSFTCLSCHLSASGENFHNYRCYSSPLGLQFICLSWGRPFYNIPPGLTLVGSFFTIFWNFLTGVQKLACDLDSEVHVTVSPFKKYVFSAYRFEQDFSLRFQTFALRLSSIVKMRGALRDFSSSQPQRWSIRGWTIRCGLVECYADTRVLWRLPSYPRRPVMTTIPTPFLILSSRREGRLLPRRRHRSWPQRCLVGNLLLFICLVDNLK